MYNNAITIYLVNCGEQIERILKRHQPLPGFTHSFLVSAKLEQELAKSADIIIASDLNKTDLSSLATICRPSCQVVLAMLAGAAVPADLPETVVDIWSLPMEDDRLHFNFSRLLLTLKRNRDLNEKNSFLESILTTSPNLIWFKDKDGVHELVSSSFCRTVNKPRELVQGRKHAFIWDVERDDPACIESERIVMESGETHTSEEEITTGEGKRLLITYKSPLRDEDGSMMGTMGIGVDVTQERLYQKRLIENNAALEAIFTSMECGILCHTLDGKRIISVNEAALKLLGYQSFEELKSSFHLVADSVLDEDKPKLRMAINSLKNIGDSSNFEYRVRHMDGELLHIMGNAKLMEKDGDIYCQRFLLDCTAQKQAEAREKVEREKRHKELVRALCADFQIVYVVGAKSGTGDILQLIGEEAGRLRGIFSAGTSIDQRIRNYIEEWVHPDDRESCLKVFPVKAMAEKLAKTHILYHNYRVLIRGEIRYCQLKAVGAGGDGEDFDIVAGLKSVDERMRREMEQKVRLEEALKQAQRASKAKSIFLSNMSHDIRTPMNAVLGYAALALNQIDNTANVSGYLNKIMDSGSHLISLINDILDMSHIESGKIQLEENLWDLRTMIDELWTMAKPTADARRHTFTLLMDENQSAEIYCDKLRLNQVLLNLLSNSIKYTRDGGKISMSVTRLDSKDETRAAYEFRIRDNGIGMSEEFLGRIFNPFERATGTAIAGIQGSGLGMAITKNIVDMMHGQIEVKSRLNEGTEFILRLNFRVPQVMDGASLRMGTSNADKEDERMIVPGAVRDRRILLAEDNAMNQEIAREFLKAAGYEVAIAANGQEAVDMMAASEPGYYDVILMDIQMPVMDGYRATGLIRSLPNPGLAKIPIIAMTANSFEEDRKEAMKRGMSGHIAKPIDFKRLFATLDNILEG